MAGYDELIKRLGEAPLDDDSALGKAEDVAKLIEGKDADAILNETAEKTLQCADLLDKAVRLAAKLQGDEQDDEAMDEYNNVIKQLIAVDKHTHEFAKAVVSSEAFVNATAASRGLLAEADKNLAAPSDEKFRELYMEEFATVFGDELDKFRQEDAFEAKDVSFLISCIQAGADVYTPLERQLFASSTQSSSS